MKNSPFIACILTFGVMTSSASAETLVAARMIRSQNILSIDDLKVIESAMPGALQNFSDAVGQETRVAIYEGRPIRPQDIGPPAIVERNQIVTLIYSHGGLVIATEGRVLGRGGIGDRLRVMNLTSRTTVSGIVQASGQIAVLGK
jgi:flagella basal body P-ring formation protein FlgA